jgi:hypothetical protein
MTDPEEPPDGSVEVLDFAWRDHGRMSIWDRDCDVMA